MQLDTLKQVADTVIAQTINTHESISSYIILAIVIIATLIILDPYFKHK